MNACIAKLTFRVISWSALFLMLLADANAQVTRPSITAVRQERTNLLITASVPAGIRRVVLESRERFNSAAWEPRAVTRLEGQGGMVNFRLPCSRTFEALRVRAEATDPLPGSFYTGQTNFVTEGTSPTVYTDLRDGTGTVGTPPEAPREVVESDIWKLRNQTLYFFNQYRGLQVIDLSAPELPVLRGTLDLPASGEQMYLLGDNHLVLLAGDPCSSSGTESQVVVVEEANGTPSIVARLPVTGSIIESRMIGHALYVASQTMRPITGTSSTSWEWGTLVSSFDLENPKAPVTRGTLWYSGYGNVVSANETFLFVAMQGTNWWQSVVRVVDITAPDGTVNDYVSIRTDGRVLDKFKLDYNNGVFTVISENSRASGTNRLVTKLETYRLPDPRSVGPAGVEKLGELELGWGERLRATRFDENRVYVVTFFQIDPLWVVDLSNPASPTISGSVDVPGWSTYIQPLGSQLVTMGVESNHVAVSLFDVADPAAPALLSRVRLGDYYSWSEANYDEKAFGVFPEDHLILVPYYGSNTNGAYTGVQLIDLLAGELVARGTIEHTFQPRRAMLYRNNILSVTGFELVSVDATDRDNPEVESRIPLAWNVGRVVVHRDYLLQVDEGATGWYMQRDSAPIIRVSSSSAPNQILSELPLSNLAILGVAHQGNQLYVAQGAQGHYYYPYYPPIVIMSASNGDATVIPTPTPAFLLTVLDLSDLPNLRVAGQSTVPTDNYSMGNFKAVFPGPGQLVWVEQANFNIWLDSAFGIGPNRFYWPGFYSSMGRLIAFDVKDPEHPEFRSDVTLNPQSTWWSFSEPFTAGGLVYMSHHASEFVPWLDSASRVAGQTNVVQDAATGIYVTNIVPWGTWVGREYLDVVDYADPRNPVIRKPVNISGALKGLSHNGAVLYAVGTRLNLTSYGHGGRYVDALAYDGVTAHLVASLSLSNTWEPPVAVVGENIFLADPGYTSGTNAVAPSLQAWTLTDEGKFERLGSATLTSPASKMVAFPGMLAMQKWYQGTELFDTSEPAVLRRLGAGSGPSCIWYDLGKADGDSTRGLWLPVGYYGLSHIPIASKAE